MDIRYQRSTTTNRERIAQVIKNNLIFKIQHQFCLFVCLEVLPVFNQYFVNILSLEIDYNPS